MQTSRNKAGKPDQPAKKSPFKMHVMFVDLNDIEGSVKVFEEMRDRLEKEHEHGDSTANEDHPD